METIDWWDDNHSLDRRLPQKAAALSSDCSQTDCLKSNWIRSTKSRQAGPSTIYSKFRCHFKCLVLSMALLALGSLLVSFFLLKSSSTADNQAQGTSTVRLAIYYETLCPDSKQFFRNQLWPTYESLRSVLDVDLVPFGKAKWWTKESGGYEFQCQHGYRECHGNMIHACAIHIYKNNNITLPFTTCMMETSSTDSDGQKCATKVGIDYKPIQDCVIGNDGPSYLVEEGQKTLKLKLTFIPSIFVNTNPSFDKQALWNLRKVVCDNYSGPKIAPCS